MKLLSLFKKGVLWALVGFSVLFGLLFMPSWCSLLCFLLAVLAAPVGPIYKLLQRRGLTGIKKGALLFAVLFASFWAIPTSGASPEAEAPPSPSVTIEAQAETKSAEPTPTPSVAPSPAPSPQVEEVNPIENFVTAYNKFAATPITDLIEFEPRDRESGYYRIEYRLGAYAESEAVHCNIGNSAMDVVYCPGDFIDSFRVYIMSPTYSEAREIAWNTMYTISPETDAEWFDKQFSDDPDSTLSFLEFTCTCSVQEACTEIMLDVGATEDYPVFQTGESSGIPAYSAPEAPPEPTPTPAPETPTYKYVGSVASDKYHSPSCRHAQNIKESNEIWFTSVEDAKAHGYKPCGTCQ